MFARTVPAVVVMLAFGAYSAEAQSQRDPYTPAEVPPASYTGNQYVDSSGCVFIRAGYGGSTNWVPRFGDDRRPMCGAQPTRIAATAEAPVQQTQQAQARQTRTATMTPRTEPRRTAPQPSGATTGRHAACPSHMPYGQEARRPDGRMGVRCTATPGQSVAQAARPASPATAPRRRAADTSGNVQMANTIVGAPCPNVSPHSQLYLRPSPTRPYLPLRCGPQEEHPADAVRRMSPTGGVWEPYTGSPPLSDPNVYQVPPTYAPVWQDGRLNPMRGVGTPAGEAAMNRVWTQTVPRQLVQPEHATTRERNIYTVPQTRTIRSHVSTSGTVAPRVTAPAGSGSRFVQVASFGEPANTRRTVARLEAQGLPVHVREVRQSGRTLQVVMAGPFSANAEVHSAMSTARQLGFRDAFARN